VFRNDPLEPNAIQSRYRANNGTRAYEVIDIAFYDVFPSTLAHEFAHGVSQYSRAWSGYDLFRGVGEAGYIKEAFGDIESARVSRRLDYMSAAPMAELV